jgi:hypothetical protein
VPVVGDGAARVQPVYVGDLGAAAVAVLERPDTARTVFELGGPRVYTYREIAALVLREIDRHKRIVGVPAGLMRVAGFFAEFRAGLALLAMRRALLPGPLPAAQQHPRLAALTAEGRLREAYELSAATSTCPKICGRICPQDRLCEGNCVIEFSGHGTVTIGSVEKYITDTAWKEGWVEADPPARRSGQSSASSARVRAAWRRPNSCARGLPGHVYDRHDRAGGLLTYGIPGFKLEKDVVMRRVQRCGRRRHLPLRLRGRQGHHAGASCAPHDAS